MPPGQACTMCGWPGSDRDDVGRCIDRAECAHRIILNAKGRPRESTCKCLRWMCFCRCHDEEALRKVHTATFDPDDDEPPTRPEGISGFHRKPPQ